MLVTSTSADPETHTCSKTHNQSDITPSTDPKTTSTTDKVNAPPPLTEDQKNNL